MPPPSAQIVSANNRKEFDEVAKWHFRYAENSRETKNVFGQLNQPIRADPLRSLRRSYSAFEPIAPRHTAPSPTSAVITAPAQPEEERRDHASVEEGESGHHRRQKAHCRRKHRRDCPKHLLGTLRREEAQRSAHLVVSEANEGAFLRQSATPPPSCGSAAVSLRSRTASSRGGGSSVPEKGLTVPNVIGSGGLATFLAGVSNPEYTRANFERRVIRDHPNFEQDRKALDATVQKMSQTFLPKDVSHPAPRALVQEKLVSEPMDWRYHRTKYEMKSHMEAVRLMGTALLREFSGAAFK